MGYEELKNLYQRYTEKYVMEISENPEYSDFNTAIFSLTASSYQFYLDALKSELLDVLEADQFRDFLDYIGVRSYLYLVFNQEVIEKFKSINVDLEEKSKVFLNEFVEMSFLSPDEEIEFEEFFKNIDGECADTFNKTLIRFSKGLLKLLKADVTPENLNIVTDCFEQSNKRIVEVFLKKVFPLFEKGEITL